MNITMPEIELLNVQKKDKIIMGLININSICRTLNLLTKSIYANNYTCHEN